MVLAVVAFIFVLKKKRLLGSRREEKRVLHALIKAFLHSSDDFIVPPPIECMGSSPVRRRIG